MSTLTLIRCGSHTEKSGNRPVNPRYEPLTPLRAGPSCRTFWLNGYRKGYRYSQMLMGQKTCPFENPRRSTYFICAGPLRSFGFAKTVDKVSR